PREIIEPVYFSPEAGPMRDLMQEAGVEIISIPRPPWWSTAFYLGRRKITNPLAILYDLTVPPRYAMDLSSVIRRAKIDLVHSSGTIAVVAGSLAARLAGVPHIAHMHDIIGASSFRKLNTLFIERFSKAVIAVS